MNSNALRSALADAAGALWHALSSLADDWTRPIIDRLDSADPAPALPKTFNDPIWGSIILYPWEVVILDSPLLQRLRGVRQLGMAYHVYPGATNDRFAHTLGVVEAAQRMLTSMTANVRLRRDFEKDAKDKLGLEEPDEFEVSATRLAALLHDIGHGPFSHVTESLVRDRYLVEVHNADSVLRRFYPDVSKIATAEIIAVILVMSEPMRRVFEHKHFFATKQNSRLPSAITARIIGSRNCLDHAPYLSGIISGPIDADKLDYMARDSHSAGLPLGLDINRLIAKLEVVTVTPQNAPNQQVAERAEEAGGVLHEIGISHNALGAYEQLIIGRVFLYDRLYYHHKVRASESMVRRLISLAEEERPKQFAVEELYLGVSDDAMIDILGANPDRGTSEANGRAAAMAERLRRRDLYHKAFIFASRLIGGLAGLDEVQQKRERQLRWNAILTVLTDNTARGGLQEEIYSKACALGGCAPALKEAAESIQPEHVLVDLPEEKIVGGSEPLVRYPGGDVDLPNVYFDPRQWSRAYANRKFCGYVFTPREYVPLVSMASRIVCFERFGVIMTRRADLESKTELIAEQMLREHWIKNAVDQGVCPREFARDVGRAILMPIREHDIRLPESWRLLDPQLVNQLAREFRAALPSGLLSTERRDVADTLRDLCNFIDMIEDGGQYVGLTSFSEKRDLHTRLRDHLRSAGTKVDDGKKVGGGETDLVVRESLVIECKKEGAVADPLSIGPDFAWQARRYAISLCSRVVFVVLAYKPASEGALLPKTKRIAVRRLQDTSDECAEVRVVVPWGHSVPSRAKKPRSATNTSSGSS